MVPAPRFRRVAALQRGFVDREPVLDAFAAELDRIGAEPRVFNVTGVGGIGKSRLLRELSDRAAAGGCRAALDLHVPALRQSDDALAVLRAAEFHLPGRPARLGIADLLFVRLPRRRRPALSPAHGLRPAWPNASPPTPPQTSTLPAGRRRPPEEHPGASRSRTVL
jgi:hypothetical protein